MPVDPILSVTIQYENGLTEDGLEVLDSDARESRCALVVVAVRSCADAPDNASNPSQGDPRSVATHASVCSSLRYPLQTLLARLLPHAQSPVPYIHLLDLAPAPTLLHLLRTNQNLFAVWKSEEIDRRAGARRPVLASNGISINVDGALRLLEVPNSYSEPLP